MSIQPLKAKMTAIDGLLDRLEVELQRVPGKPAKSTTSESRNYQNPIKPQQNKSRVNKHNHIPKSMSMISQSFSNEAIRSFKTN